MNIILKEYKLIDLRDNSVVFSSYLKADVKNWLKTEAELYLQYEIKTRYEVVY